MILKKASLGICHTSGHFNRRGHNPDFVYPEFSSVEHCPDVTNYITPLSLLFHPLTLQAPPPGPGVLVITGTIKKLKTIKANV